MQVLWKGYNHTGHLEPSDFLFQGLGQQGKGSYFSPFLALLFCWAVEHSSPPKQLTCNRTLNFSNKVII